MRRIITCLLILSTLCCFGNVQNPSSRYFEFHNDYWINLHHFLYQRASGGQLRSLKADGFDFKDIGEDQVRLSNKEEAALNNAVAYYKEHLINKNLRRDLGDLRLWLQKQTEGKAISDTSFSLVYTELLNKVAPVYTAKFWPIHKSLNKEVIDDHIKTIKTLEERVISEMERLAMYKWPQSTPVRVDLTVYANYAGAYTAAKPEMNIFISTIDPLNTTTSFVEGIFHEGSHLLFNFNDSPFRGEIYHQAKAKGIDFPRNLWHASMFYLSGRVVQDAFLTLSIEHQMDLDLRNIFSDYNTPPFRTALEKYYQGDVDFKNTVEVLLANLNKKSWNAYFDSCSVVGSTTIYNYNEKSWLTNYWRDTKTETLPASTFKILHTLIALETGTIKSVNDTIPWPGKIDTTKYGYRPKIFKDITVREAYQRSAGWAYVEMAKKLGKEKYLYYLDTCNYGNLDLSINDDDFWNFGTFGVTPQNQLETLVAIYEERLPFSKEHYKALKEIMIVEQNDQYTLRGKTGWTREGGKDTGWWVGYIETKGNVYFFATRIVKDRKDINPDFSSCRKEITHAIFKEIGILE